MSEVDQVRAELAAVEATLSELSAQCAALVARPMNKGDKKALLRGLEAFSAPMTLLHRHLGRLQLALHRETTSMRVTVAGAPVPGLRPAASAGPPLTPSQVQLLIGAIRYRTGRVTPVLDQVRLMAGAGPVPLYAGPAPGDLQHQQALATDAAFLQLHRLANPAKQDPEALAHGCFADIALAPSVFAAHAHAATRVALAQARPGPWRFLDVGCGGGVKVLQASAFFPQADGLEFDPGYVEAANRMLKTVKADRSRIMQGDALTFEKYGHYDVIYFYQPMSATEGLHQLERRIAETSRSGTILIAPYAGFRARGESLNCQRIDGDVHVVGLSADEAEALRQKACHIGPHINPPTRGIDERAGFLTPLIMALRRVGYAID